MKRLAAIAACAALAALAARLFVFETIYIASGSMEPTLHTGADFFLDKVTLRLRPPRRGEIVSFYLPEVAGHESVKRVIAVGGDTVEIKAKKVFLNGKELYEPYAQHIRLNERLAGDDMPAVAVPPDSVFVLGDNRDASLDGATWKNDRGERIIFLPLGRITGKLRGPYREY
ncbi:MAG: signal peptidase I [Elusimicrobiales bacterium]